MFRNRQAQKPSDELYKNFKAKFPLVNNNQSGGLAASAPSQVQGLLTDALDLPLSSRTIEGHQGELKDADTTPHGNHEPWTFGASGLTPSLMDPNSHGFNMFANQMPGYYTPTPGGTSTLYHSQAGDLHTPNFGGLGTPLSMPTSEGTLHAGQQAAAFHGFHAHIPQHMQQSSFQQHVNPFQMQQQPQQPQQAFPPHHFTHQPSFESMEGGVVGQSPVDDLGMDVHLQHHHQHPQQQHHHSPEMMFHPQSMSSAMHAPLVHPSGEKFRYHVTLNAPTAMIKHSDEIPITYLNKGQAYTLNVVDTHCHQVNPSLKYRTYVRISFEDEQQRAKPSACWQLWKEGRGTNEAHQRDGRLQAVEYVESGQMGNAEDPSKPRVELEYASFDGFSVIWSPPAGAPECPISVRFNFLSTDFSHSKGVKGIPVRLCAKTELLSDLPQHGASPNAEVCYSKVKLFRDHGAERKLSNDVAHVKKTIDKLNQQISQIESGMRDMGKRKRGSGVKPTTEERPGKVAKHRRTWSMSSITSNGGRGSAEEDLHMKLMTLQDMFTSTRPASVLYLRGADQDDPDLYPVRITGEPQASLARTESGETSGWDKDTACAPESLVSPTPSSHSLSGSRRGSALQQPTPFGGPSRVNSSEWRSHPQTAVSEVHPQSMHQLASPSDTRPIKVQTRSPKSGTLSGWIETLGVDSMYQPPAERAIKPAACFYVQPRIAGQGTQDTYYRAIYPMARTLRDFVKAIALKSDIEPTKVLRTIRVSREGLHILFDDDCIRELAEGQDMTAEFCEIEPDSPSRIRREWDAGPTDVQCDGDMPTLENTSTTGYELKLLF